MEFVEETVTARLERVDDDEGTGARRQHLLHPQIEVFKLAGARSFIPDGELDLDPGWDFQPCRDNLSALDDNGKGGQPGGAYHSGASDQSRNKQQTVKYSHGSAP